MASSRDIMEKFRELEAVLREGDQGPTVYREGLRITRVSPGTPKDPRYTGRVRDVASGLLAMADVTGACREYVLDNVMTAYNLGLPPNTVLGPLGISPERNDLGIFDPGKAGTEEKPLYEAALQAETLPERIALLARWGKHIEEKYPQGQP